MRHRDLGVQSSKLKILCPKMSFLRPNLTFSQSLFWLSSFDIIIFLLVLLNNFFGRQNPFCVATGLLVMSALGFIIAWIPYLACLQTIPQIHLWCHTRRTLSFPLFACVKKYFHLITIYFKTNKITLSWKRKHFFCTFMFCISPNWF